jgi:hypothetical protein
VNAHQRALTLEAVHMTFPLSSRCESLVGYD